MATAAPETATASHTDKVLSSPEMANFCEHIFRALLKDIHREVLVWPVPGAEPLTFTSTMVMNRVSAIREELQARQVAAGHRVLLTMPFQFDLLCTLLAVMAEGAIPVLPPAKASPRVLVRIMRGQNVRALVTEGKVKLLFSGLLKWLGIYHLQTEAIRLSSPRWQAPQAISPEQPAFVSHFSGPTGRVMAICRSHRVLQAQLQARKEAQSPWSRQRGFPLFPHRLLFNLATGTTSVLPDLPSAGFA
jgi:olefin beta-lactone synthetase